MKGFRLSSEQLSSHESFEHDGVPYALKHGDVILAAITGCTNATSSSVMLAAGNYAAFPLYALLYWWHYQDDALMILL